MSYEDDAQQLDPSYHILGEVERNIRKDWRSKISEEAVKSSSNLETRDLLTITTGSE